MTTCGIYRITNLLTGKSYIGQSVHIEERIRRHKQCPKDQLHYPLYQDMCQFGIDNFNFEILEVCTPELLNEREIYWIAFYDTYYSGYNQTKGGTNSSHIVKISEEMLSEIVDLLQHSSLTQSEIAKMFDVGNDTISEINQGKSRYNAQLTYPLRNNQNRKTTVTHCVDCGIVIGYGSTYCHSCANKYRGAAQRKVPSTMTPTREELKILLKQLPFTRIAEKFGVTDNSVRKWCDKYGLPRRAKEIKQISQEEWELL